ncbi:MAG: hypothetical protein R2827_12315 [Bdellovibrionales bacterium]
MKTFRFFVENVDAACFTYVLNKDGTDGINFINEKCVDLWEVGADEAKQNVEVLWSMIDPSQLDGVRESVLASGRDLTPWRYSWKITTPSGNVKWLRSKGMPVKGKMIPWFGIP